MKSGCRVGGRRDKEGGSDLKGGKMEMQGRPSPPVGLVCLGLLFPPVRPFSTEQHDAEQTAPALRHSERRASAGAFYVLLFGCWNINPT